ncbi:hypothetical protein [Pyrobaculum aerophilum]|uniref:hypothetical protein n=1 Tax=Pyrobaculum aerophilum TaxID=13773 RepID=UPI0026950867|nr:hypothetical protein [Pyrobaculum aerophilum]
MLSKPGLGVYLVASWPSKDTYEKAIRGLEGIADFFELGLPSKNPKYDVLL